LPDRSRVVRRPARSRAQSQRSMKVSVIMPAFNAERYLEAAAASVIAQTLGDWELVIVDDGSSDGTPEIADGLARRDTRVRVLHQDNRGVSSARNAGLRASSPSAPYVLFFDADDLLKPECLEVLAGTLDAHPEAVAACGFALRVESDGSWTEQIEGVRWGISRGRLVRWPDEAPITLAVLAVSNPLLPGFVLIRRDSIRTEEPFDPDVPYGEDWLFWLRLSRSGALVSVPRILLGYRRHGQNASVRADVACWRRHAWAQMRSLPGLTPEEERLVRLGEKFGARHDFYANLYRTRAALRQGRVQEAWRAFVRALRHRHGIGGGRPGERS